ncbi:hypothetical protein KXR87_13050 [Yokenella regensburgei]|uniref:hypothetical protein n=1 Tax=Yokenella regensburgei TaxID=158877 RepID=UPI003F15188A
MSGFKGTPGPWIASTSDRSIGPVCKDDDQSYGMIIPVAWVEFDGKPGHHQANANLIAAAPELLEALRQLREYVEDMHAAQYGHNWVDESHPMFLAQAAIAKALGDKS